MGKISRKTLCALALTALCAMGAGVLLAENPREAKVSAAAQTAAQTTLVAPNSYEQYLELTHNASVKVSDVAVTENFTAVANDKTIFVYNRKQGVYTQYSHPEKVTKLQFSEEETLYFLDSAMQLYSLEPKSLTATRLDFSCNTLYIAGQKLFFTAISGDIAKISVTDLLNPDVYAPPIQDHLLSKPAITYWENELYYTDAGKYLYKIDPTDPANTHTFLAAFRTHVRRSCGRFLVLQFSGLLRQRGRGQSHTDFHRAKRLFLAHALGRLCLRRTRRLRSSILLASACLHRL